jgi:hypothetical protein
VSDSSRRRSATALVTLGAACLLVAFLRRHDVSAASAIFAGNLSRHDLVLFSGSGLGLGTTNWSSPFHPFDAYVWLGAGVGFIYAGGVCLAVPAMSARVSGLTAPALAALGLACSIIALALRHSSRVLPSDVGIEGAYFNASAGGSSFAHNSDRPEELKPFTSRTRTSGPDSPSASRSPRSSSR